LAWFAVHSAFYYCTCWTAPSAIAYLFKGEEKEERRRCVVDVHTMLWYGTFYIHIFIYRCMYGC
jgi:hypothetical protein